MARATIKDVAARSGFSTSTVSRALSGKIFVEEETKRKILEAVEELHYRPSMIAKSLKDKKTKTIAVMVPDLNSLFYWCIDKKNSGMNTYTGATFPLFLLVLNSISTFGIFTR